MRVEIHRELTPIVNGWQSRHPEFGLAAHGYSPDVADRNLERTVRLFLMALRRAEGQSGQEIEVVVVVAAPDRGGE